PLLENPTCVTASLSSGGGPVANNDQSVSSLEINSRLGSGSYGWPRSDSGPIGCGFGLEFVNSSDRYVANHSTTSSCSAKRTCAAFRRLTLRTTMRFGHISHWIKMLQIFGERR